MPYVLRFVQRYRPADRNAFMELEAQFAALEQAGELPKGQRRQPYAGREPVDTLIWEGEFATIEQLHAARLRFSQSELHEALFRKQAPYMLDARTEIDELLEF